MRHMLIIAVLLGGCSAAKSTNMTDPPVIDPVIYTAATHVGYTETENRQELKEILGVDPVRTQWCAAYVNAVLAMHDIPGSETVSRNPLMARSFLAWGYAVPYPEPGDVVVFPRGNKGWQGHVGFYVRSHMINGSIYYLILGGNQDNSVSYDLYPAKSAISIRRYLTSYEDL